MKNLRNTVQMSLALLLAASSCSSPEKPDLGPTSVQVVKVTEADVPIKQDFVGEIYGIRDVPIRARVDGFLDNLHFKEGFAVKKGQLLYEIDPQPFLESVSEMESSLASAKVALVKAENDLERVRPLAEINAVSKSDLDAAVANKDAAEAQVQAAEANVRMAEINLSYTKVKSPINGMIGKSQAYEGEYVGRSPNPVILNTVSRIDSVKVEFFLVEQDFLRLSRQYVQNRKNGIDRIETTDSTEQQTPGLDLILADGSTFDYKGRLRVINREVDPSTGSLLLQAVFPNPNNLLRPGQFGKIRTVINQFDNIILVPQRCVTEVQGNFSVLALGDSNKVHTQTIQVGGTYRDYFIVTEGLKNGEQVVYEGLQKVRDGAVVSPKLVEFTPKYPEK